MVLTILKYMEIYHYGRDALEFLEFRALESKSSSSNKLQLFVVLIPAVFGFAGAIAAVVISLNAAFVFRFVLPTFMIFVLILLISLLEEIRRTRFDSALLIAIHIYRSRIDL